MIVLRKWGAVALICAASGIVLAQSGDPLGRYRLSERLCAEAVEAELGFSPENAGLDVSGFCRCVFDLWEEEKWSPGIGENRRLFVPYECVATWPSSVNEAWWEQPNGRTLLVDYMLTDEQWECWMAGRDARDWMAEVQGLEYEDVDEAISCLARKLHVRPDYNSGEMSSEVFWQLAVDCGVQLPRPTEKKAWLAVVTRAVNCREGPGTAFNVIGTYQDSTQLIVESLDATNGYYPAFDLSEGLNGWVHKGYVEIVQEISYSTGGILNPVGEVLSDNAFVEVENDAGRPISIRFDDGPSPEFIVIADGEVRELILKPGQYRLVASTATPSDVKPYIGFEGLKSGIQYSWIFFIR